MLTQNQRLRAATIIAEMAKSLQYVETEEQQHDVAYSMQEFALMLLGEANMELAPSDNEIFATKSDVSGEYSGEYKVIIIAPDSSAVIEVTDAEVAAVKRERQMNLASWLKTAGTIDLECIF